MVCAEIARRSAALPSNIFIAPEELLFLAVRACALMMSGRKGEARTLLLEHRGKTSDGKAWEAVVTASSRSFAAAAAHGAYRRKCCNASRTATRGSDQWQMRTRQARSQQ